jgi:hypothetical protein
MLLVVIAAERFSGQATKKSHAFATHQAMAALGGYLNLQPHPNPYRTGGAELDARLSTTA